MAGGDGGSGCLLLKVKGTCSRSSFDCDSPRAEMCTEELCVSK